MVFHVAGVIEYHTYMTEKIYKVNVNGTQSVVDACLKSGVKKLIYTSSIEAVDTSKILLEIIHISLTHPLDILPPKSKPKKLS